MMHVFAEKGDIFKYFKIFLNSMSTQINLRMSEEFLERAKEYAAAHGFLTVQEFFREAAREKVYEEVRPAYKNVLASEEANTFISDEEARASEKEWERQARMR
jgi:hypothetical protein